MRVPLLPTFSIFVPVLLLEIGNHYMRVLRGVDLGMDAAGAKWLARSCALLYAAAGMSVVCRSNAVRAPALRLIAVTALASCVTDHCALLSWHLTSLMLGVVGILLLVRRA